MIQSAFLRPLKLVARTIGRWFLRALRELFCTSSTFVPEVTHAGAIVVVNLPVLEFGQLGQLAQTLFKFIWQRATERRDVRANPRPVFCWADEAQYFANGHDSVFQSTARSSHTATVYLTQNLANFHMVMSQAETLALLGNLSTKICCANGDAATNEWASQTISRTWTLRASSALSRRDGDTTESSQHSFSQSDSLEQQIQPHDFTVLRKGGPEHNW